MADNVQLNQPDTLGAVIATDDVLGVQHQLVKVEFGDPDSATQVSASNPLPVTDAALAAKDFATQTTLAAVLVKLSADPATQTTLAAVLAKLTSDPATQTTLAAILAKLIAAPSTEAKQDTANTSLASIDSKLTNPLPVSGTVNAVIAGAVEVTNDAGNPLPVNGTVSVGNFPATQPVSNAGLTNLDVLLSTRTKPSDQQHTIVDSGTLTAVTAITNALPSGANYIGYVNPDISSAPANLTIAGSGASFAVSGMQFVGLIISGSPSNFIFKAQVSLDGGTTWDDTYLTIAGGTNSQTASLVGQYQVLILGGTTHIRVVLNSITSGTFTYKYTANMAGNPVNLSVSTPGFNTPPSATMVGGVDSNGKLQVLSTTTGGVLNVTSSTGATEVTLAALYAALALTQGMDATTAKGPMVQGLVNDAPASYLPGQLEPVSLTSDGRIRVSAVNADITRVWNNTFDNPFFDESLYGSGNNYFTT